MRVVGLCLLAILVTCGSAESFHSGGSTAELIDQAEPSAVDVVRLPTVDRQSGEWHFASGWSRLYNLAELDELVLAGGYRYRSFGVGVGVSQFGRAELYAEQTMRVGISCWRGPVGFGLVWSYRRLDLNGRFPALAAWAVGGSLSLKLDRLYVSASADDLNRPRFSEGSLTENRTGRIDCQYVSERDFTILGSIRIDERDAPRFSIGQTIDFTEQFGIFWQTTNSPWMYGGGLQFRLQPTTFRYTVDYHPVLGVTHAILVAVSSHRRPKAKE